MYKKSIFSEEMFKTIHLKFLKDPTNAKLKTLLIPQFPTNPNCLHRKETNVRNFQEEKKHSSAYS